MAWVVSLQLVSDMLIAAIWWKALPNISFLSDCWRRATLLGVLSYRWFGQVWACSKLHLSFLHPNKEEKLKSGEDEQELAFSGLTDRCIEKSIGEYKYKICDLDASDIRCILRCILTSAMAVPCGLPWWSNMAFLLTYKGVSRNSWIQLCPQRVFYTKLNFNFKELMSLSTMLARHLGFFKKMPSRTQIQSLAL